MNEVVSGYDNIRRETAFHEITLFQPFRLMNINNSVKDHSHSMRDGVYYLSTQSAIARKVLVVSSEIALQAQVDVDVGIEEE